MTIRAITTKYLGYTNRLSSRIKATGVVRTADRPELALTDQYDQSISAERNHCRVARLFAAFADWPGLYVAGALPSGSGNCYVNLGNDRRIFAALKASGKVEGVDWFYQPVKP